MTLRGSTMIDVSQDIQSMTTFKRKSVGLVKRMRRTGRPLVLTVKGKAEVVVMDAGAYQQMADRPCVSLSLLMRKPNSAPRLPLRAFPLKIRFANCSTAAGIEEHTGFSSLFSVSRSMCSTSGTVRCYP